MHADLESRLKAARNRAPAPRIPMGAAFVHGRARGLRRGMGLATGLHLALGCALAAIAAALWMHPGDTNESAVLAACVAGALWMLGWLRLR